MQKIEVGIGTKFGIFFAIVTAAKPTVEQVVALVENTQAHWNTGDKLSLISAAAVGIVTLGGRFAQAVAQILRGQ